MTTQGHTLCVSTTDETERYNFAILLHPSLSSSLAPWEIHFLPNCTKTLVGAAVLLNKKGKGQPKPDCEKKLRGISNPVLSFAKVFPGIWSLSEKQIQISKRHGLRQG